MAWTYLYIWPTFVQNSISISLSIPKLWMSVWNCWPTLPRAFASAWEREHFFRCTSLSISYVNIIILKWNLAWTCLYIWPTFIQNFISISLPIPKLRMCVWNCWSTLPRACASAWERERDFNKICNFLEIFQNITLFCLRSGQTMNMELIFSNKKLFLPIHQNQDVHF